MNKFRLYFTLLLTSIILFSCNKNDDDTSIAPPRDFAEQYTADIDSIEGYLKTHHLVKVEVNGLVDVVIDSIPEGNPEGLISIWDNTEFPLQSKILKNDSRVSNLVDGKSLDPVEYKMYYVMLSEGNGQQATSVDSTFVTYRGWTLDNTEFEVANAPSWFTFPALTTNERPAVSGFRQFTSLLKKGDDPVTGPDGSIIYSNYGSGVVFIPSGLGYFNRSPVTIPSYSPLIFTIRLHAIRERDHDRDGVLTKYESLNTADPYTVDTDGDGIPDFLDIDDDGDGYLTRREIRYTMTDPVTQEELTFYYPFNGAPVDDPNTIIDETKGIPSCEGDFTSPTRLRKHLDPNYCD
ncbi:MAG: hypothetical protein EOO46_02085 [Flavobacterium sp.]|nr:MAG: hypothetical protein EOO46_02085 [Flavobacterium sp.]